MGENPEVSFNSFSVTHPRDFTFTQKLECFMKERSLFRISFESPSALQNYNFDVKCSNPNIIKLINTCDHSPSLYNILDYVIISKSLSPGPFQSSNQVAYKTKTGKLGFVFVVESDSQFQPCKFYEDQKFSIHEEKFYNDSCNYLKQLVGAKPRNQYDNCFYHCKIPISAYTKPPLNNPCDLFNIKHPVAGFWQNSGKYF